MLRSILHDIFDDLHGHSYSVSFDELPIFNLNPGLLDWILLHTAGLVDFF